MVNLFFPPLNFLDGILEHIFSFPLRLCLWGILSGVSALFIYAKLSHQEKIENRKREIKELQARLSDTTQEFSEILKLTRKNIGASFALLGDVFVPSMLSSIPILLFVFWLSAYHGYLPPPGGSAVRVEVLPVGEKIKVTPADLVLEADAGHVTIKYRQGTAPLFYDGRGVLIYKGLPINPPVFVVHKRKWWNMIIGNEAGYLPPNSSVEELHFGYNRIEVFNGLPGWMSRWEFTYFSVLFVSALFTKFFFKIH